MTAPIDHAFGKGTYISMLQEGVATILRPQILNLVIPEVVEMTQ